MPEISPASGPLTRLFWVGRRKEEEVKSIGKPASSKLEKNKIMVIRAHEPLKSISSETKLAVSASTTSPGSFYLPLSVDHLLTLVHFNVFRALLTNMTILSLPGFFSCEEPKTTIASLSVPLLDKIPVGLPPTLVPTPLQRSVQHDAWIDLFPLPELRDNLIRLWGTFDTCEICDDVLGTMYDEEVCRHDERNGLVVWGDPWDVYSWELMEGFVRKWGYILAGCDELIEATNQWRARRGEEPLLLST